MLQRFSNLVPTKDSEIDPCSWRENLPLTARKKVVSETQSSWWRTLVTVYLQEQKKVAISKSKAEKVCTRKVVYRSRTWLDLLYQEEFQRCGSSVQQWQIFSAYQVFSLGSWDCKLLWSARKAAQVANSCQFCFRSTSWRRDPLQSQVSFLSARCLWQWMKMIDSCLHVERINA